MTGAVRVGPVPASPRVPFFDRLDQWLGVRHKQVIALLVLLWIVIRAFMVHAIADGPLIQMYKWPASDNCFFDEWARTLAGGDWLNRRPLHPYHPWHREFAELYLKQHPEKLDQILKSNPGRDSAFTPGKALWNEWYGGNTYHQEPLYAYVLALLYVIAGDGVYWMAVLQNVLGVLSGLLLWLTARRYFGDTAALLTGLLYLFCGIILFQEDLLLRTSWSVFFAILTTWTFDRAFEKRTKPAFFTAGLSVGLAFVLQSTFILFLLGALMLYFRQERRQPGLFMRHAAVAVIGFLAVYSPVVLRNAAAGAPPFSISAVGAVTFAAANVYETKTVSNWAPEASKCAEIMGKTGGHFGPVVVETLATHPSAGSYARLLRAKLERIIDGLEWPNNENYYFYRQAVPALRVAFLDFYWIVWAGAAGILFSLYHRKKTGTYYLAVSLQVAILLIFYVLGRFRTPLAALLLPFSAYALAELMRVFHARLKESTAKIGMAAVCFYFLTCRNVKQDVSMLDPTDYNVLYELVYLDKVKNYAGSRQWGNAIAAHEEFLLYQPDFVRNAKPGRVLKYPPDIDILDQFAEHFKMHGFLYEDSGNKVMAAKAMARYDLLKQIAENSRKYLKK